MNKLIKPLIVLIILLAVWLMVKYTGRDFSRPDPEKTLAVQLDETLIRRIEINRGEEGVSLLHSATGDWQVKTEQGIKPAEAEAVASALANLNGISTSDIVSHNPEKQAEYRVDDANGTKLRVYGEGDALLEGLVVGKLGGFESQAMAVQQGRIDESRFFTYMRRGDSDRVYKVKGFFAGILGVDAEQWRDHVLMKFEPSEVQQISLAYPDEKIVLEKDINGSWAMTQPQASSVDSTVVERMAASLSTMRASSFVDSLLPAETLGFDQPTVLVGVKLANGSEQKVSVGSELEDNLYYCVKEHDEQVYTLARFRLDQFMKRSPELVKEDLEEAEKEGEE
jgi:hypothetical protein